LKQEQRQEQCLGQHCSASGTSGGRWQCFMLTVVLMLLLPVDVYLAQLAFS
jgi:hypothetical protein